MITCDECDERIEDGESVATCTQCSGVYCHRCSSRIRVCPKDDGALEES